MTCVFEPNYNKKKIMYLIVKVTFSEQCKKSDVWYNECTVTNRRTYCDLMEMHDGVFI